jgi:hypothetical protein
MSNHYDTIYMFIESFHHASVVHGRLCTKLFESIQYLLPSAYKGLFMVYLKALRLLYICSLFNYFGQQSLHSSNVNSNSWILRTI